MGGTVFSHCMETKHKDDFRKVTGVAPNKVSELNLNNSIDQIERFYFIPHEQQINKTIEYLEEAPIITDKDSQILLEMITELASYRRKLGPYNIKRQTTILSKSASPPSSKEQEIIDTNQTEKDTKEVKEDRSTTVTGMGYYKSALQNLQKENKEAKKPVLLVEVRCAKFLHEEILQKHELQKPYVVVKVYERPDVKQDYVTTKDFKAIEEFKTHKVEEKIDPRWTSCFDYEFELNDGDKQKRFPLYSVGVALFYTKAETNEVWQVGEEQHFSLSPLQDQRMQTKVIDFKDHVMKGVLARVKIVFQLLHNVEEVRERLKKDVEIGIERLVKVKEKHMVPGNAKFNASLLNSMAPFGDGLQSVMSVYSFAGVKDTDYYIES